MGKERGYRSPAQEREQRVREVIFGTGPNERCLHSLTRATGIPTATLCQWRKFPGRIPLRRLWRLCEVLEVTPEDAAYLLTGKE